MTESASVSQQTSLGDVVRQVKEKVDAKASGLRRYVAGQHMTSNDLRIRSWGTIGDDYLGPAFHMRFRPGQVLYGSRRTYLRKVSVADFDGICANTTFVLESLDPKRMRQDYLPFLLSTDAFHRYSIKKSRGSVNPYVNFSDIAKFQFELPPLDVQAERVGSLRLALENVDASLALEDASEVALNAALKESFSRATTTRTLESLALEPVTYGIVQAGTHVEDGVPYIRVADITKGPVLELEGLLQTTSEISSRYSRTIVSVGDLVVAVKASRGVVGQVRRIPSGLEGANMSRDVARVSPRPEVVGGYLYWALRSPQFMREVQRRETGWKGDSLRELTVGALRELAVPWVEKSKQTQLVAALDRAEHAWLSASRRRKTAQETFRFFLAAIIEAK